MEVTAAALIYMTGPGGLLGRLTNKVLETAPAAELTAISATTPASLGWGNGATGETVRSDIGRVRVDVRRIRHHSCGTPASFDVAVISP